MSRSIALLATGLATFVSIASAAVVNSTIAKAPVSFMDFEDGTGFNVTSTDPNYWIQTSYKYHGCSANQQTALKQATEDATDIAWYGLKLIARPGAGPTQIVDFGERAAIEFFGPTPDNADYQGNISTTIRRSSEAYPGSGWGDWWSNRYVLLRCTEDEPGEVSECNSNGGGKYVAYVRNSIKSFGFPVVTFCDPFFSKLSSLDATLARIDQDANAQQNSMQIRSQASTMLHEWMHMNWGYAQVCPGDSACVDHKVRLGGGTTTKIYRPGRARMYAKLDFGGASNNNDNLVWFCLTRLMTQRYGQYPAYPLAWNPQKTVAENQAIENQMPGAPQSTSDLVTLEDDPGEDTNETIIEDLTTVAPLPASAYPDWYQPMLNATLGHVPNITEPSDEDPTPYIDSQTMPTGTISQYWKPVATGFTF